MTRLSRRDQLLVGLTLFSMFFGAGNLIFPPFLGAQAGTDTWPAFLGFAITAIGFPVLGVVAVAQADGLTQLASRVHPKFAVVFTILIYLSIGPGLAIPRTATTSFEMAVIPFVSQVPLWGRIAYSLLFFGAALLVALQPEKLTDRLGRITGPCLLLMILVVFLACLFHAPGGYGQPGGSYTGHVVIQGFLDGYQTMDTIAALNFGIVIALNIRARGVTADRLTVRSTVRAGWIAGGVLLAVYAALAHVGALSGGAFPGASNGAVVLAQLVGWQFGTWGSVLLGLIFVVACLNTCIGLVSSCSEYFSTLLPRLRYPVWAILFAALSLVLSIAGLDAILAVSTPILGAIYPMSIVLILLGLTHRRLGSRFPRVYPVAVACTGVVSVLQSLDSVKLVIPGLTALVRLIPLDDLSLGWLLPAAAGVAAGILLSPRRS